MDIDKVRLSMWSASISFYFGYCKRRGRRPRSKLQSDQLRASCFEEVLEASKSQREINTSNAMFCFSLYLILSLDSLFTQEIHTIFPDAHPPRPLLSASLKDGSVQAVCHGGPTSGVQIICRSERADGPASPRQRHRWPAHGREGWRPPSDRFHRHCHRYSDVSRE